MINYLFHIIVSCPSIFSTEYKNLTNCISYYYFKLIHSTYFVYFLLLIIKISVYFVYFLFIFLKIYISYIIKYYILYIEKLGLIVFYIGLRATVGISNLEHCTRMPVLSWYTPEIFLKVFQIQIKLILSF